MIGVLNLIKVPIYSKRNPIVELHSQVFKHWRFGIVATDPKHLRDSTSEFLQYWTEDSRHRYKEITQITGWERTKINQTYANA